MQADRTNAELPTYEGWSNRPTWSVNLWLSNDRGLYESTQDLLNEDGEAYDKAERLESFVRELVEMDEASIRSDLLGWALAYVDWREIVASWEDR